MHDTKGATLADRLKTAAEAKDKRDAKYAARKSRR